MKNLPAVILITIIVNVLCWLMLDAWDKEEALRMERQQQHFSMMGKSHGRSAYEVPILSK